MQQFGMHYGVWCSWAVCTFYTVLLLYHEGVQLRHSGGALGEYFSDPFNIIDWSGGVLTLLSLTAVALDSTSLWDTDVEVINMLDVVSAEALLLTWFKVLYFM